MNTSVPSRLFKDAQKLLESLGTLPEPTKNPVFIALSGLPGTGKSYFSRKLAEKIPLAILESDALRKNLFLQPNYSWRESARLFRACHYLIEYLLKKGISLIMDATNLSEQYRRRLYDIADRLKVKFIMVKLEAPPEVIRARLANRVVDTLNRSDADWRVYQAMRSRVEKISRKHYIVNTAKDITPLITKIVHDAKT